MIDALIVEPNEVKSFRPPPDDAQFAGEPEQSHHAQVGRIAARILTERSIPFQPFSIALGSTNWAERPKTCTQFATASPTKRRTSSMRLLSPNSPYSG
jgi:hypothetical protein